MLAPAALLVLVAFVYPIALLLYLSLTDPKVGLDNYLALLQDGVSVTVLLRTLRVAAVVTVVTLVLAYPYAYTMTAVGRRTRTVLLTLVLLPFWTSLMARTFAWVVLFQDRGPIDRLFALFGLGPAHLLGTSTGVAISMAQVLLPFKTLPLYASLDGIDRRLVDAALGLGARPVVAFLRVYLPLSVPGVLGGALMVFVLSLGFYVTPALLGSPGESMISQLMATRIQEVLQFGAGGALGVIVLLTTLVLLAVVARFTSLSGVLARTGGGR
jgi:putative spermidine/putrescine transport system permease protein